QVPQPLQRDDLAAALEHEVRGDGEQVGVAAPFAVAVRGALGVDRSRVHGGHGVGDGTAGVVVGVDAELYAGQGEGLGDDGPHLGGQGAAVGVAQDDGLGARLGGGADHFERVLAVELIAVEVVLGVDEHAPPGVYEI